MRRAVLSVLVGLAVVALGAVATAPELFGDLGRASSFVLVAFAAGIPGLVVLVVLAATRRGRHDQPGAGRPHPGVVRPLLTAEDLRQAPRGERPPAAPDPPDATPDRTTEVTTDTPTRGTGD